MNMSSCFEWSWETYVLTLFINNGTSDLWREGPVSSTSQEVLKVVSGQGVRKKMCEQCKHISRWQDFSGKHVWWIQAHSGIISFRRWTSHLLSDDGGCLRRNSLGDMVAMVCTELSVLMLHLHMGSFLGAAHQEVMKQVVPGMEFRVMPTWGGHLVSLFPTWVTWNTLFNLSTHEFPYLLHWASNIYPRGLLGWLIRAMHRKPSWWFLAINGSIGIL